MTSSVELLTEIRDILKSNFNVTNDKSSVNNSMPIRTILGEGYTEIETALQEKTGWGRTQVLQIIANTFSNMQKQLDKEEVV